MNYDPNIHHRRSIRLQGYDYSQAGAYFVSIIVQTRECLFGEIINDNVVLNPAGQLVQHTWEELPTRFPYCDLDAFVVMPNHIHSIIIIDASEYGGGEERAAMLRSERAPTVGNAGSRAGLGAIVRAFKSMSAIQVNRLLGRSAQSLWQRNYYEHVIRDEEELNRIRDYIIANPAQWAIDRENPAVILPGL